MSNDKIVADAKQELESSALVQKVTQKTDNRPAALRRVMRRSAASHPVTFWKVWFAHKMIQRSIKKRDKKR